jgi:predicted nucleic acid-binding protein
MDCLIAAVAVREGMPLLEQDRGFRVIAAHTEPRLHVGSSGAAG